MSDYKKAIKEMNKAFKPRGIKFEEPSGWERYKQSIRSKLWLKKQ